VNIDNIGLQLYTLRDYLTTKEDFTETLRKVSEIGYKNIELVKQNDLSAKEVREIADMYGIRIISSHTSLNILQSDLDSYIEDSHIWGAEFVGIGIMPAEYRENKSTYIEFINKINIISDKLKANGLTLVYHNHAFEFEKKEDELGIELLYKLTKNVGLEIDFYWVQAGGASPCEWAQKLCDKNEIVHFKDMRVSGSEQLTAPVGGGNINWKNVKKSLETCCTNWIIVEQDRCYGENPFDCIKESFDYLKGIM